MPKRCIRYPFHQQHTVSIPVEWALCPVFQICANPQLPAAYVWEDEHWLQADTITWNPDRSILTLTFRTPQSGTVVLEKAYPWDSCEPFFP